MAAPDHATLLVTRPADGSIVSTAPEEVVLTFDEGVAVSANSIEVFSPGGHQVEDPPATTGTSDSTVEVGLRSGLGRGTYTVGWQVVSDDSHPVSGTFAFSVGAPSHTLLPAGAARVHQSPAVIGIAFGVARWLGFISFAILVGGMGFILIGWPGGCRDPAAAGLLTCSVVTAGVATLAQLVLQGPYTATSSVSVFSPGTLRAVLVGRYGHALELRLVLLAALSIAIAYVWPLLDGTGRTGQGAAPVVRPGAVLAWAAGSAGLAATWSSAEHAAAGAQVGLSVTADIAHLVSMGAWAGGLVMLWGVLLRKRSVAARPEDTWLATAVTAVRRFSALAMTAVIVLTASGVYETWRNVGAFGTLVHTSYGRVILLKSAGLALLICLGYLARGRIRRLPPMSGTSRRAAASGAAILRRLRISVMAETALVLIVLALSAALVEMPTGREAAHATPARAAAVVWSSVGDWGEGTDGSH